MTLQELAKEAIEVQDACNIGGVSRRFAQVVQEVRVADHSGSGTDFWNRHPIIQLWASKIHSLAGMGFSEIEEFSKAYDACLELAGISTEVAMPA